MTLCKKHYQQMYFFGEIKARTIKDMNEIVTYDDYAEVILYNRKCEEIQRVIIDTCDIHLIDKFKWTYDKKSGYAIGMINGKHTGMHRIIMNTPDHLDVDHKNGNRLNNRRDNLRNVTQSQNSMNAKTPSTNKSGYKGVLWHKRDRVWTAQITKDYKVKHLGYFDKLEDAIAARKVAEEEYFGEYAYKEVSNGN